MTQNNFKVIDYNLDEFSKFIYNSNILDNVKICMDNKDLKFKIPSIVNKIIIDKMIADPDLLFYKIIYEPRCFLISKSINYFKDCTVHYIASKIDPINKDFINKVKIFKCISVLNVGPTSNTKYKYIEVNDSKHKNTKYFIKDNYIFGHFSIGDYLSLDSTAISECSLYSDLYYNSVGIYIKLIEHESSKVSEYFFKNTSNSLNKFNFHNNCNNFDDYFVQLQYYNSKIYNDCILFDLCEEHKITF